MQQDGVYTTTATTEMMPVWRHVDDVLIKNLEVRVAISTRIPSKGDGYERWGSKPNKSKVAEATKISCRVW